VKLAKVLQRGSLISGASRLRWDGFAVEEDEIEAAVVALPGDDPTIAFDIGRCSTIRFRGYQTTFEILRKDAIRKGLLHRKSLLDLVGDLSGKHPPQYKRFDYQRGEDIFRISFEGDRAAILLPLLRHLPRNQTIRQLAAEGLHAIEFFQRRPD
jgi:hypothetical protein